ncbi:MULTISPECIES: globin [unclassified Brevibacterium]|uniref:globin n=1 Tax=unclassified Brevibacterium TaxID=2614124 RepID=UPI0008A22B14|nr:MULTISPECIES: globin [unclassified Brevibacterium]OFL65176.1 globin [Brevibacterium sp. HMSC063G07]
MTNGYERPASVFDMVGGHAAFTTLVDAFYEGVAQDEYLIAMYPEGRELEGAKHRLQTFLEQYFGGPATYQKERGHPRLRMRHAPFPVTPKSRDHWLGHMRRALDQLNLPPMYDSLMWDYFQRAATAMLNTPDEDSDEHRIDPSRRLL